MTSTDYNKRYYWANREQEITRAKEWAVRNKERRREANRAWRAKNKERVRRTLKDWQAKNPERAAEIKKRCALNQRLRRKGISLDRYNEMLKSQAGFCAICGRNDTGTAADWHIDHDHRTGRVRGLLCHFCNVALGCVRDSTIILRKMIVYLEG